jgi:hypothetical protein
MPTTPSLTPTPAPDPRGAPEVAAELLRAPSVGTLPRRRWDQPSDVPVLRGPTYLEDRVKVAAMGGPTCTLFAVHAFELDGDHVAGATAAMLQRGALVPPPTARFVLSMHFMCPRHKSGVPNLVRRAHTAAHAAHCAPGACPRRALRASNHRSRNICPPSWRDTPWAWSVVGGGRVCVVCVVCVLGALQVLLAHFWSPVRAEDATGASGALLRELWSGDAAVALSRCKILVALRSGPQLVRHVLSWLGLDDTRPMLLNRQVHSSLNRATLPRTGAEPASPPATPPDAPLTASAAPPPAADGAATSADADASSSSSIQHVEVAFDTAASPLCNQVCAAAGVETRLASAHCSPPHWPCRSMAPAARWPLPLDGVLTLSLLPCMQMFRYAYPSLPSVDFTMTLVLEARASDELPEHHVGAFSLRGLEPSEIPAQPDEWPQTHDDVPGVCFGSRSSARGAGEPGSWQATRAIIDEDKRGAKNNAARRSRLSFR